MTEVRTGSRAGSRAEPCVLREATRRWDRWVHSPAGARTRTRWGRHHPGLAGWSVAELRDPAGSVETDALQATLVTLAQAGDQDALLTLIVQLRPGLRTMARWALATGPGNPERPGSLDEAAADAVGTLAERILAHPVARRPTAIAGNLLMDSRQRLWRSGTRQSRIRRAVESAAATGHHPAVGRPEAVVGELALAAALSTALRRLPGDRCSRATTAEVAYRAWVLDQPRSEIGRELGLGTEAISSRLCRLRTVLRRELRREEPPGELIGAVSDG